VQFGRQNSNQRQARPLPEAETSEELFPRVLQGGCTQSTAETGMERTSH